MSTQPNPSFAEKLAMHRQRLGLTQAGVAALLDVGLRTYATWERADDPKRRPHLLTREGALARLAKITRSRKTKPSARIIARAEW